MSPKSEGKILSSQYLLKQLHYLPQIAKVGQFPDLQAGLYNIRNNCNLKFKKKIHKLNFITKTYMLIIMKNKREHQLAVTKNTHKLCVIITLRLFSQASDAKHAAQRHIHVITVNFYNRTSLMIANDLHN